MKKTNKYSYYSEICDHDIWYIYQVNENDGIEKYKYIAKCLFCGKVIMEDRWEHPLPCYSIKGEIKLNDGSILFVPYNQIYEEIKKITIDYIEENNEKPSNEYIYNTLLSYYG